MTESRRFIILSHRKDSGSLQIHGTAERYNTQLSWEAIRHQPTSEWCIRIPRQPGTRSDIQQAYQLIVGGFTDFRQDLMQKLQRFDWTQPPALPFPLP